jgi:hypothetical protein
VNINQYTSAGGFTLSCWKIQWKGVFFAGVGWRCTKSIFKTVNNSFMLKYNNDRTDGQMNDRIQGKLHFIPTSFNICNSIKYFWNCQCWYQNKLIRDQHWFKPVMFSVTRPTPDLGIAITIIPWPLQTHVCQIVNSFWGFHFNKWYILKYFIGFSLFFKKNVLKNSTFLKII